MKYIFLSFFIVFFYGCEDGKNHSRFGSGKGYPVDTLIFNTLQEPISSDEVFADIQFIPLEAHQNSMFNNIDDMLIFEDKMYVLSKSINKVLIYDLKGKFLNFFDDSINGNKINFLHLRLDDKSRYIMVRDGDSGSVVFFDLNGKYQKFKSVDSDFYSFGLIGDKFVFFNHYLPKDSAVSSAENNLIQIRDTSSLELKNSFLGYNPKSIFKGEIPNNWKNFHKVGTDLFLTIQGEMKFYNLSKDGVINAKVLKLNKDGLTQIPSDFIWNADFYNKRKKYLEEHMDDFYNIRSIFGTKNGLIYTIGNRKFPATLLQLNDGRLIFEYDISYESHSSPLPPICYFIYASDDTYFYSYYPSKNFLNIVNNLPNRSVAIKGSKNLEEAYSKTNLNSNGVIVKFKLKDYIKQN